MLRAFSIAFAAGVFATLLQMLFLNLLEMGGFAVNLVLPGLVLGAAAWLAMASLKLGNARAAVLAAGFGVAAGIGAAMVGVVARLLSDQGALMSTPWQGFRVWIMASVLTLAVVRGLAARERTEARAAR